MNKAERQILINQRAIMLALRLMIGGTRGPFTYTDATETLLRESEETLKILKMPSRGD